MRQRGGAVIQVLFVCMGNICRSPTAEAVFRAQVQAAGLTARFHIDSAGTHGWHAGAPPDARSQAHAERRGYDLSALRARQLQPEDFERSDHLLVMDQRNLRDAARIAPARLRHKLQPLMAHAPETGFSKVPDPYSGSPADFERVLDLCEAACGGLLRQLQR